MSIRIAAAFLVLATCPHVYAQKACVGQYGPIVGCSSDSRHFPCYTSPDAIVQAMCQGKGSASLIGKPHKGNKCGYHYFQVTCQQGSGNVVAATNTQEQASEPYFVAGRIRCMENGEYPSFEITVQSSASGESCASARQKIESNFRAADRCKYSSSGTFPNRSWDGREIQWLQTTTCR